ncbi:metallophosphoesterase [Bacillus infantis]|uniref:Metallophosphoesterase n=1 Tax=Bacillus infantis TaxID=324767 RepID=A0A5D4RGI4_9BACI|nr:metallophosphoesterase [Bacillus infantis]TYS49899.1 metallophosphoesterase [Bacillus infantis]
MTKKISRRSFLKTAAGSLLTALAAGSGSYYYAREIEPKLLDTAVHKIIDSSIPQAFNNFRAVQFSDTHIGFQYTLGQLEKLAGKINSLEPDIIFFTGDLMDEPNKFMQAEQIVSILKRLNAPFGKYAVYGNHDHGGYGSDIYKKIIEKSGFRLLLNESHQVKLGENSIYIAGVDDAMLGRPDLKKTAGSIPEGHYSILLSHAPDLADKAYENSFHFQLSGHSHGGQVKIPFFGALVTPPYGQKYYEGFYTIGDEDPLTLYVNRGLGTTRLPFRFLSKPELTLFTFHSS